jgi:hypothetical protein
VLASVIMAFAADFGVIMAFAAVQRHDHEGAGRFAEPSS